jgi:CHAD domain-containing protein
MAKNVLRVQKLRARLKRMREAYHAYGEYVGEIQGRHISPLKSSRSKNRHLSRAVAIRGFIASNKSS